MGSEVVVLRAERVVKEGAVLRVCLQKWRSILKPEKSDLPQVAQETKVSETKFVSDERRKVKASPATQDSTVRKKIPAAEN